MYDHTSYEVHGREKYNLSLVGLGGGALQQAN